MSEMEVDRSALDELVEESDNSSEPGMEQVSQDPNWIPPTEEVPQ